MRALAREDIYTQTYIYHVEPFALVSVIRPVLASPSGVSVSKVGISLDRYLNVYTLPRSARRSYYARDAAGNATIEQTRQLCRIVCTQCGKDRLPCSYASFKVAPHFSRARYRAGKSTCRRRLQWKRRRIKLYSKFQTVGLKALASRWP